MYIIGSNTKILLDKSAKLSELASLMLLIQGRMPVLQWFDTGVLGEYINVCAIKSDHEIWLQFLNS